MNLGPLFLASLVFTITLADHAPWDHHALHEQGLEQVVVYAAPITIPTSGSFALTGSSSTARGVWIDPTPDLATVGPLR